MSLTLSNSALLSNNQVYLTSGSNQSGQATVSVAPANTFMLRYYLNQTGQVNTNTLNWGDSSNVQYSLRFNQQASNISLYSGSNTLLSSNIYPLPLGSNNEIGLRQILTNLKLYVNQVQQFSYSLASEINPTSGSYVFSATSSNGSNIVSSVLIDPTYSVNHCAEFLQDVSISGLLSSQSVVASSATLGTISNAQLSAVQAVASSNSSTISNLSTQSTWTSNLATSTFTSMTGFSNEIYAKSQSNLINNVWTSNTSTFSSNTATWTSNNFSNVATTSGLAAYSNFVSSNYSLSNVVYGSLNALSNFSTSNNAWSSNGLVSLSNFSTSNYYWTSNGLVSLSNFSTSNYYWTSNGLIALSNFSTSNHVYDSNTGVFSSNLSVYSCNNFATVSNTYYAVINSNTTKSTWSSNNQSNLQTQSGNFPYSQLTGAPSFNSTTNNISIAGAALGAAGLAIAGTSILNSTGAISSVLQSADSGISCLINAASGYMKLGAANSYMDIGLFSTHIQDSRIIYRDSNQNSNLILDTYRLITTCNGTFQLNSLTTSNNSVSITSNLSVGSNLFITGTLSNGGNATIGGTMTAGATTFSGMLNVNNPATISGVHSTHYSPSLNTNSYLLNNFGVSTVSNYNAAYTGFYYWSNASPSNYLGLGLWGQILGTGTLNIMGNGNVGVKTTTPAATLDVNGSINTSGTLTATAITGNFSNNTIFGGLLGIQNTSPASALDIIDSNNSSLTIAEYSAVDGVIQRLKRARGTAAAPSNLLSGDSIFGLRGFTYASNAGFVRNVGIDAFCSENQLLGSNGSYISFSTTASNTNTITEKVRIDPSGNVGIGTSTPAYKLDVNGTVNATILKGSHDFTQLSNLPSLLSNTSTIPFTSITSLPALLSNNVAYSLLTGTPPLLSNSSSLGWSNVVGSPSYVGQSNTSLSVYSLQTPSDLMRIYTSNLCVGIPSDPNLGVHVWANGVDGASFSSNGGGSSNQGGLSSWFGLSFKCLSDSAERHLFNCRTGDTTFLGALSNTGNVNVGGIIQSGAMFPSSLNMSTNPIYIQNGNAGITYANVSGTGQGMDGPAIYGWQGGVLGYVGNGSNFAPGRNGINGSLYWNYSNVGIGLNNSNPTKTLDISGTFHATGAATFDSVVSSATLSNSGNTNIGGYLNVATISNSGAITVGGVLAVNQQTDSGVNKGIRLWDSTDTNWALYMCQSGAGKSAASNTACTSIDGRTAHHVRFRNGNGNQQGWIWENNSENCMMSLTDDTGNLYVRNLVQTSNVVVGNTVAASNSTFGYDGYGQVRQWYSTINNSVMQRYDGSQWYFLISSTSNGSWNSLRPLTIVAGNGYVGISNANPLFPLDVGGTINCTTLQGNLAYSYLTSIPAVLSNTSPAFTTVSNAAINASNCVNGVATCTAGGLQFPASDPGWMTVANYGGSDRYGFGQWAGGQTRAVISGSYGSAAFNVCKPFNSNYTSWSNLLSVDTNGNCSNLGNLNVGGMINVTNQLNVQGYLQLNGSGVIGTQLGQLVFLNSAQTASNVVFYNDGSTKFRNGMIIQTAQISSNVFAGDATFSHVNNHNSTGFMATQSSGGLTTINATTGNAVRTAINGSLTSSHSANGFSIGADAFAIPSFNQVGSTPVIITNPGGYITFSTATQGYLDTSQIWGSGTSTCMGQLLVFMKTTVINPVSCMLTLNVNRLSGQTATYVQQSFMNSGMSINNYSIPSGSNGILFNLNAISGNPTVVMNFVYTGIL